METSQKAHNTEWEKTRQQQKLHVNVNRIVCKSFFCHRSSD